MTIDARVPKVPLRYNKKRLPQQSASGFDRSLWANTAPQWTGYSTLVGPQRADVLIIGAGITGISAALALAEQGARTIVLEQEVVGWGASGRSGGFVVPSLSKLDPDVLVNNFGEIGERLVHTIGASAEALFSIIRRYGIDCHGAQGGWFQPAHSRAALSALHSRHLQWEKCGVRTILLDSAQTAARTGCPYYFGSLLFPTGGTIHPLLFTRGLCQAAVRAGAKVFEHTHPCQITRRGNEWEVQTNKGSVAASSILVCANARTGGLLSELDESVASLRVVQMATKPISFELREHLFQKGEALSDTRINLFTYRFDSDWRLITGALPLHPLQPTAGLGRQMARSLRLMLQLPHEPEIQFLWDGQATITSDLAPKIVELAPQVLSATSCNGRGIAMSAELGRSLANALINDDWSQLPVPITRVTRTKHRWLLQAGISLYPLLGRITDGALPGIIR